MKKKLIVSLFSLTMLFAFSTVSMADPIAVGDKIVLSQITANTDGGPFNVTAFGSNDVLFITFCLERNEWTSVPLTVSSIADSAVMGGLGGGNPDALDERSAFLYYQFRSGVTYNLDALQVAFWAIEQEADTSNWEWNKYWATYGTLAQSYINAAAAAINNGWTNDGKIQVMNVTYVENNVVKQGQSQLVYVPEPMSLLLLGLGMLGLGITRKLKK